MQRRRFTAAAGGLLLAASGGCAHPPVAVRHSRFHAEVQRIEAVAAGRLGVCIRDTASGAEYAHRADELFPMTSTFKMLVAALVLSRVDRGIEQLSRRISVQAGDIVPYAPVTQPRVNGDPMTVAELCHAAVAISDNPAANVLLRSFGGPAALTAFARSLGDPVTRLDRMEPELNEAKPGDPRDTTSPRAMLRTMDRLVLGNALAPASREQLTAWLLDNRVGATRLRAGLPAGWRIADKTGAGANGTNNDVGVLWTPAGAPVLVTAYLTGSSVDGPARDRALADVARLAVELSS
jgi:beta-lactamase class A